MDILQHFVISLYTTALSVFILALLVYFNNPYRAINRTFAFYSMCIAIWGFGQAMHISAADRDISVFWARFFHAGVFFISTGFIHFALSLVNREKEKQGMIKSLYALSSIFFLLNFTGLIIASAEPKFSLNYYWIPGPAYPFFLIYWLGSVSYALALLLKESRSATGSRKTQLAFLFWASFLGYIGGISNYLPAYDINFYPYTPFGTYAVPLYSLVVAYTITRYRFMDIKIVIRRTAVYSLSAGLLTALFVVLVLTLTNVFSMFAHITSFKVSIFAAILIAILFNPLRNRVQTLIDKLFFKKSYDFYDIIRTVSRTLVSLFDFEKIYDFVGDTVYSTFGLKNIHILTTTVPGGGYETVYQAFRKARSKKDDGQEIEKKAMVGSRSGIVKFFRKSQDLLVKDELQDSTLYRGQDMAELIKNDMDLLHGEVAVPVFVDNKLHSMIVLGEKLSGDMFTSEDINLLNTIANQTSIAIKNAGLYKDKVDSERMASIGMMSATFAHEIRNPLTSLKTFAQLMPEKYNDEEFRETFSKIVEGEIDRIDGLIGDLLDFSQEKKATRLNNFNLVELVDGTVRYVEGKLEMEKRSIEVNKEFMEKEIYMSGDAEKLKQTFINIMMNGCQAMNGEGELTVAIERNSRHVDVSIRDTGKGISPDELATIFDPFVTTKEMGVGLGLAISKRIVEDHMGKIQVKSKLSKGTTFTVSLPVQN